jgi:outer membrane murein-binding lipoprotein Lpp
MPATSGILITSGDTGTVTNTMLAGSIADSKLLQITTAVATSACRVHCLH